jgi:uncharacterized membrane protein YhaH (DUF805 family)
MTETRFNVVFDGTLLPGVELTTAKYNLAELFKTDVAAIERLFTGAPVALKRDLTQADAQKYLDALLGAGLNARLQAQPELSLDLDEVSHPAPATSVCAPAPAPVEPASPYAPPRTPLDATQGEYAELKVFSVEGRIGRMRYLAWSMVLLFACIPAMGISALLTQASQALGMVLLIASCIALAFVMVVITAKRLHDLGWSAWLMLLNLVPVVNTIFSILILVMPGHPQANLYGPPPPPNSTSVKVLAWIWIGVIILAFLFLGLTLVGGSLALLGAALSN